MLPEVSVDGCVPLLLIRVVGGKAAHSVAAAAAIQPENHGKLARKGAGQP
jgi:hypothetical protein